MYHRCSTGCFGNDLISQESLTVRSQHLTYVIFSTFLCGRDWRQCRCGLFYRLSSRGNCRLLFLHFLLPWWVGLFESNTRLRAVFRFLSRRWRGRLSLALGGSTTSSAFGCSSCSRFLLLGCRLLFAGSGFLYGLAGGALGGLVLFCSFFWLICSRLLGLGLLFGIVIRESWFGRQESSNGLPLLPVDFLILPNCHTAKLHKVVSY